MEDLSNIVSRVVNADYGHSRHVMPEQPWWDNLESNFYKFPDDFELDLRTKLLVDATAYVDIGIRTVVASLLATLSLPLMFNPLRKFKDQEEIQFYQAMAETADASAFFQRPADGVEVRESEPAWYHFQPDDGECRGLTFDSPFQPVNENLNHRYLRHSRNRVACAQHWRHSSGPRPTICVIHGFMADPYWLNSKFLELRWFYQQGYDILLYTLPFHGARQGRFSPFSGHGYFSGGMCHLNESVAHSVYDFRVFLDYLDSRGVEQYGVTGISLGGYTSAILAAVEDRLAFSIPNVPVVSIVDVLLQWAPASWVAKILMRFNGLSIREARHQLAVHNPLTYKPKLPRERLMIVGGAGDRLAPPKHSRLLWDHWDRCQIHWFPGNHVIHLDQGKYLKEMLAFMQGIDFR
ncbi:MAG: alpha/beta hydrolase [Gammaproteobacteria bacterium]|nr:alpha/beta hydrolase [Gammaproteobacteria bacterium]